MKPKLDRKLLSYFDWPLFGCTLLIVFLGLLNLYSATLDLPVARYFRSQFIWTSLGLFLILILVFIDYRILERLAYPIYVLTLLLLVVVLFMGKSAQGAQRWIPLGPVTLQPSELAKIAMAICLAKYFHSQRRQEPMGFAALFKPFLLTVLPFVLILKQPDLGTSLIVLSVSASMILFMGVRRSVIITLVLGFLASAPLAWKFVLRPYQKDRVISFLNPEKFPLSKGYQVIQSKVAIGSGQLVGKGYLKGSQSKLQFLPKQHTDFVFSNFAEEFGFVGSMIILALYASLAILGLNVALNAKEAFGMMLAFGLTMLIACQAVINLGMETGALPVVGMTLPLFSYGGTSLLVSFVAIGILLNISMRRFMF